MATHRVPLPADMDFNTGLTPIGADGLTAILGLPRSEPLPPHVSGGPCFAVTNQHLDGFIVGRDVGPFRVTGLQPAVDLLADVLAELKQSNSTLHNRLGTAGMLCVRRIAGSTSISNHSWGTAVDLTVDNVLDVPDNGRSLPELIEIAPLFNRHGWFWGAEFPHEDSMHFEISLGTMQKWQHLGLFTQDPILQHGHSGTKVAELQRLLNQSGVTPQPPLPITGNFADKTLAAVHAFQLAKGLDADDVVGPNTWAALRA